MPNRGTLLSKLDLKMVLVSISKNSLKNHLEYSNFYCIGIFLVPKIFPHIYKVSVKS